MDNNDYPDANQLYGKPLPPTPDQYPDANALYGKSQTAPQSEPFSLSGLGQNAIQDLKNTGTGAIKTIGDAAKTLYKVETGPSLVTSPKAAIQNALQTPVAQDIKQEPAAISQGLQNFTQDPVGSMYRNPITTAMDIYGGLQGAAGMAETASQNMGRRALGVTKGMMKKMPGGIDTANQLAQVMINQGVPQWLAGAKSNLESAENALSTSGQTMGNILDKAGVTDAIDTTNLRSQVYNELAPSYPGIGAYAAHERLANEIIDTINAHGREMIDLNSAQDLRNTLKAEAGANWQNAPLKAAAYQKAYMIVGDAIEDGINKLSDSGKIPQDSLPQFQNAKKVYQASKMAVTGLRDKAMGEAANNVFSLPGVISGAGAIASGNIKEGLGLLGTWEAARRYGAGFASRALNAISNIQPPNSPINPALVATGTGSVADEGNSQ